MLYCRIYRSENNEYFNSCVILFYFIHSQDALYWLLKYLKLNYVLGFNRSVPTSSVVAVYCNKRTFRIHSINGVWFIVKAIKLLVLALRTFENVKKYYIRSCIRVKNETRHLLFIIRSSIKLHELPN